MKEEGAKENKLLNEKGSEYEKKRNVEKKKRKRERDACWKHKQVDKNENKEKRREGNVLKSKDREDNFWNEIMREKKNRYILTE